MAGNIGKNIIIRLRVWRHSCFRGNFISGSNVNFSINVDCRDKKSQSMVSYPSTDMDWGSSSVFKSKDP